MATDFRSDTVTRPTAAMRAAMAAAPVGDDVFGDDPSVNALEAEVAELLGFEAAMFVPSGTQSNLVGVMTHCARGDEYIVGQDAHTYRYEAGGAAVLGSVQPQPLDNAADGTIPLAVDRGGDQARRFALREDAADRAREHDRRQGAARGLRRRRCASSPMRRGLAMHLDGARLWNAAVKQGVEPRAIAKPLRFGVGVPVEGPRRAGRVGAVRRPRFHQERAPLAQDAGRRHAAGGDPRGGGPPCARASHPPSRRRSRERRAARRGPRQASGARRRPDADQHGLRRRAARTSPSRSPRTSPRRTSDRTERRASAGCTHLDVSRADVERAIACVDRFFARGRERSDGTVAGSPEGSTPRAYAAHGIASPIGADTRCRGCTSAQLPALAVAGRRNGTIFDAMDSASSSTSQLTGMTCAACAARIEKVLNRTAGVRAAVNFATETAHVEFDAGESERADADRRGRSAPATTPRRRSIRSRSPSTRRGTRRGAIGASSSRFAIAALLTLPLVAQMAADGARTARLRCCRAGCNSRSPRRCSSGSARASIPARGTRFAAARRTWTCWSRSARARRSRSASPCGSCRCRRSTCTSRRAPS